MHAVLQVLFDLARYHAPSTIFLDEIDALMGEERSQQNMPAAAPCAWTSCSSNVATI